MMNHAVFLSRPGRCMLLLLNLLFVQQVLANTGDKQQAESVTSLSTVVVNGVPLAEVALNREINRLAPVAEYHSLSKQRWQSIREQAIDNLVDRELFYREAIRRGIGWDEQWVEYIYDKNRKELQDSGRDASLLDDEKLKLRLMDELRQTYVISKLWQQGRAQTVPTQQEIENWYGDHRDNYRTPLAIKVEELLLKMKPSSSKADWDKARKRITRIFARIKKRGSFSEYRKTSDITITEKTLHEGMQSYDVKALSSLADNSFDKPSFSLHGYRIIKKLSTIPQVHFSLAEVEKQVRADVHNHKYQAWLSQLKQELRDHSEIIIGAGPGYVGK